MRRFHGGVFLLALLLALADARTVRAGGPLIIKFSDVVAGEPQKGEAPNRYAELTSSTARPVPWCPRGRAFHPPYLFAGLEHACGPMTDPRVAVKSTGREGPGRVNSHTRITATEQRGEGDHDEIP